MTEVTLYLDRIEDGYAVLYSEDEDKVVIPCNLLPPSATADSSVRLTLKVLDNSPSECYNQEKL